MKEFWSLIKISLNMNFGISALKYRFTRSKDKLWEPVLIGVSAIIGFGTLIMLVSALLVTLFVVGKSINQPEMVLTFAFAAGQMVVLILGAFYVMGTFYFSRDINILIPLPLKPSYVLGSKFIVVMANIYLTMLPFVLPSIIIYGVGTGQWGVYWIKGIILLLAAPMIPLIISSLLILVLMRFVNLRKSKDLLAIVGGFFGLFIALGLNFSLQRIPEGGEQDIVKNLFAGESGLINAIGSKFPPSIWATYGLSKSGWVGIGYFALFIGISALLFIALLWLGNKVFYKSLLSGQEVSRSKKTLSKEKINSKYDNTSSPILAIFHKEWKLFIRTPVYLMNGLAGMIIGPFFAIMPFISKREGTDLLLNDIHNQDYVTYITLGGLAFVLFIAGMNIVASTSISREGSTFWISKLIPVPPKQQVIGKLLHAMSVCALGISILVLIAMIVFRLSLLRIPVLIVLGLLGSLLIVALNLMIDVMHPKLGWTNPQEAVKKNINSLFGMLITLVIMAVLGALCALLISLGTPEWLIYLNLAIVMTAMTIPSVLGLFALAERRYARIEV